MIGVVTAVWPSSSAREASKRAAMNIWLRPAVEVEHLRRVWREQETVLARPTPDPRRRLRRTVMSSASILVSSRTSASRRPRASLSGQARCLERRNLVGESLQGPVAARARPVGTSGQRDDGAHLLAFAGELERRDVALHAVVEGGQRTSSAPAGWCRSHRRGRRTHPPGGSEAVTTRAAAAATEASRGRRYERCGRFRYSRGLLGQGRSSPTTSPVPPLVPSSRSHTAGWGSARLHPIRPCGIVFTVQFDVDGAVTLPAMRLGSDDPAWTSPTMMQLEEHGPDVYVGVGPRYPWGGLYGGQIVAQGLRAAAATVEERFRVHSLHAYFIRRGDHAEPIRFEVDRMRNGRSFRHPPAWSPASRSA